MSTKSLLPYLFLMTGILSGCALNPEQCDSTNRDASTVEKFRCRDAYKTNVEKTQLKLDNAQELNQQFKAVYDALDKERKEVGTELRNKKSEYAALQTALGKLLDSLNAKATGNAALQAEVASVQQELEAVTNDTSPSVIAKQEKLNQLKQRVTDLQNALGLQ